MSMIGKSFIHYEISAEIGRGGMGEVYQAKDTKLGRDVAIKVLPEEFARDTDRVARFQREAKLLASLNHPNIAAIYGLEESEGTHFLVMELIEGDTLRDRIKSGPIPVEEALNLALQMAEALEAAHENGVIHRDLKPANIKVTPDGKVKILDFGLAKAYAGDQENVDPMDSPTISAAATQQGVILGTAAYMSPEQAKGKSVDKRADIWAFGVVLFEMLTGRQSFTGETASETLASVMKSEPEWDGLPINLHFRIRFVLERCLKKEPKDRYSGINDARVEIQEVLADPSGVFVQQVTATEPETKSRSIIPWIVAIVLIAIIAGLVGWYLRTPEPRQVMRSDYHLPEGQEFTRIGRQSVTVSADGTKIVYVANQQLYLKNANELTARPIPGTNEDPANPFFSPDGQWVGYFDLSNGQLKKIAIMGGAPVTLCQVNEPIGATWGSDDVIVFGQLGGIMRVSSDGGSPEIIVEGEDNQLFLCPQILPDGKSVLFTFQIGNGLQFAVQSLESGERKDLIAGGPAQYLGTGHLAYALENNLSAVPFDLDALEISGGPVPLVEGIFRVMPVLPTHSAISDSGTLVYIPGITLLAASIVPETNLVWVDRDGKEELLGASPNEYLFPKISPDGTRLALTIMGENDDIWVWDLARKTMTRLTFDKGTDYQPIWTPDSMQVLFWSEREGDFGAIFRKRADGTGEVEMLVADPDRQLYPWALSSDGKTLVVLDTTNPNTRADISMLSMEGDHERKPLLQQEYMETQAKISPDGRWMAYVSNESGRNEIYVRSFPEIDKGRWQVSTDGGVSPLWAPNGSELFYIGEDDSVMTVAVETGTAFSAATPEKLFSRTPYLGGGSTPGTPWDVHPDGKRFLMLKRAAAESDESAGGIPRKINIVLNWDEELKQRVPVD
jgi:serine/threonine protein kinase/Tol biopolymer transport system component